VLLPGDLRYFGPYGVAPRRRTSCELRFQPHNPPEPMSRLPDSYLEYVLYLHRSARHAAGGGHRGGTGFLVSEVADDPVAEPSLFAVTAAHVIDDGFSVVSLNRRGGGRLAIELRREDWTRHPAGDDVAVARINLDPVQTHFRAMARDEWFLTPKSSKPLDIGVGDQVVLPGRFVSHAGRREIYR
jgi:hypothetical protein